MPKIRNLILTMVAVLALSSCDALQSLNLNFGNSSTDSQTTTNSSPTTSSTSSTTSSSRTTTSTSTTSTTSSTTSSSTNSGDDEAREVTFYAINDFHGAVQSTGSRAGIVKVASFLKRKKIDDDAVLINSGDMWQGSIESNYNRGQLLTDVTNAVQFDCFTLGNHEFDWGTSYIQSNREREYDGYSTPFLAANVYNYSISNNRVRDYADLGEKYTIRTLDNGLKIGIIGVIGTDQITSISSAFVDDLTFTDPVLTIKQLSNELRTEQGCDIVVASCHCDQDDIDESVTTISNVSNKRYVDAVFCAHTHQDEYKEVNGVPYIQSASYGQMVGVVKLSYQNGECELETYGNLNATSLSTANDAVIESIVAEYGQQTANLANESIGNFSGTFYSNDELPNLVCTAIANFAKENDIDIDYAMTNVGRSYINSGIVTYGEIYQALPFNNLIYVIETKGEYLSIEAGYNYIFRLDNEALDMDKTYRVAVIDYLATHRNSRRAYDYFPDVNIVETFEVANVEMYNYRDLVTDYIRNYSGTFDSYDFTLYGDYRNYFDSTILDEAVYLPNMPYLYAD